MFPTCSTRRRPVSPEAADVQQLELRMLLTVDLIVDGVAFDFFPSPTEPNLYTPQFKVTVVNVGTTTASLTGSLFNLSDNVVIEAAFSNDTTIGNIDDGPSGSFTVSGLTADSMSITLAPNERKTFSFPASTTLQADPLLTPHFLIGRVDATNVVSESNESNNATAYAGFQYLPTIVVPGNIAIISGETSNIGSSLHFYSVKHTEFDGTTLSVTNLSPSKGDKLSVEPSAVNSQTLKRAGKKIKLGKTVIGSISGGKKEAPLTMTFNENSNNVLINTLLKHLTLKTKSAAAGARSLKFDLTVPGANPTQATLIVSVNHP